MQEGTKTSLPHETKADDRALVQRGDPQYRPLSGLQRFFTRLRLIRALPWRRFPKGSVLVLEVHPVGAYVEMGLIPWCVEGSQWYQGQDKLSAAAVTVDCAAL